MSRRRGDTGGYTLLELLVVIVIASLLVGIAIPAFRAILSSSRRSLAESKLRQAMFSARDAAASSVGGGDAAAVFFFEPGRGIQIVTCVQIGTIADAGQTRDVFVPATGFEPAAIPQGLGVRGFALATANVSADDWYETVPQIVSGGLGSGTATGGEPGYWVFPETAFYDRLDQTDGKDRQTFMVRFRAGDGSLSRDPRQALILAPSTSAQATEYGFLDAADIPELSGADDLRLWGVRVLSSSALTPAQRLEVFGNTSANTVLAAPVTELAVYDERELARAVGARGVNRETSTLYLPPTAAGVDEPTLDTALYTGAADRLATLASRWIEGRLVAADVGGRPPAEPTAQLYMLNAYFAELVEINR